MNEKINCPKCLSDSLNKKLKGVSAQKWEHEYYVNCNKCGYSYIHIKENSEINKRLMRVK